MTVLNGGEGMQPRGLVVTSTMAGDVIDFTGNDATSGVPGVFKLAATGGAAATTVVEGSPFVDPSGIAILASGDIYVTDTIASKSQLASIIKVSGGTATAYLSNVLIGYPAGLAVDDTGTNLIMSGLTTTPSLQDSISAIDIATMASTPYVATGLAGLTNAAGLHRALNVNTFAFVDSAGDGTDAVYVIK